MRLRVGGYDYEWMPVCQAFCIVISLNLAFLSQFVCALFADAFCIQTIKRSLVAHTPRCPLVSWLAASVIVPAAPLVVVVVPVWPARL